MCEISTTVRVARLQNRSRSFHTLFSDACGSQSSNRSTSRTVPSCHFPFAGREQVKASLSPQTSLHNDPAVDRQAEPVASEEPHVGLPHDVLLHVIAHCDRQTLIAWASTNKPLNEAAVGRLVAHMDGTSFARLSACIRHNRPVQQTTFRRSSRQAGRFRLPGLRQRELKQPYA